MGYSATLLLTHRPTPTRCDEIAAALAAEMEVAPWAVSWYLSDDVPAGYDASEVEQLLLRRMLAPDEAIYFTVVVDDE